MAAIDLKNLTKIFGSMTAVNALTLSIPDKEFVALLGPSGCGKTTTMNMIAGIEHSTSGSICFNGVDVAHVPPGRRGIGFVFQNYAIFTHMTVRANLAFGLEIRHVPPADIARKVVEMAALMRLSDKLDRDLPPLVASLTATSDRSSRTVDVATKAIVELQDRLDDTLTRVTEFVRGADQQMSQRGADLHTLLTSATQTVQQARETLNDLRSLTSNRGETRANLDATLRDLAAAAGSLRGFANDVEHNPQLLLTGRRP